MLANKEPYISFVISKYTQILYKQPGPTYLIHDSFGVATTDPMPHALEQYISNISPLSELKVILMLFFSKIAFHFFIITPAPDEHKNQYSFP